MTLVSLASASGRIPHFAVKLASSPVTATYIHYCPYTTNSSKSLPDRDNYKRKPHTKHHGRPSEGAPRDPARLRQGGHPVHEPLHQTRPAGVYQVRIASANLQAHEDTDANRVDRVCQAVGVGFLIMGVIGYFVKLSMCVEWNSRGQDADWLAVHIPVNRVLVG